MLLMLLKKYEWKGNWMHVTERLKWKERTGRDVVRRVRSYSAFRVPLLVPLVFCNAYRRSEAWLQSDR